MGALLEATALSYHYDGGAGLAIDDVSFALERGDFLCVVGENGSGKSTLVRVVTGLVKPSAGKIVFAGIRANEIGYLPQQTPVQKDFPASVLEVVLTGRLNRKRVLPFYDKNDRRAAAENLAKLGVADLASRSYRTLSGGQQQRVLLARALCASGALLVLDEPVTGLDPPRQQEMYQIIRDLNEGGMTILMVSHDARYAATAARLILHLDAGKTLFFGTSADYARSEAGRSFLSHGRGAVYAGGGSGTPGVPAREGGDVRV